MASPEVTAALKQLESAPAASKASGYNDLLGNILQSSSGDTLALNLTAYVESLLGDHLGIVASRPLLASFVERFRAIHDPEVKTTVGQRALQLIQPRVVSYEDQDTAIKEILADAYEAEEDFTASAKVLSQINLDSSQRTVSADDKARTWIRIVRCYLEEDDPTTANTYLNRAKNVLHDVTDKTARIQFQLCQARILDSQRAFLDASSVYHTLSHEAVIDTEERLQTLSAAIKCAVLGPAGPQRGRMLARLYKDDRASQVEEFGILEKIFLNRLLSPDEKKDFERGLAPHQLAKTADGSTVLDKAVLEHNLLAASRLYANIGIDQLGELLGVDGDRAEQYAAQMIEQGRLSGYIDQIERFIFFEGEGSGERKTGQREVVVGKELRKWDANVLALAEEVEKCTTMIREQHPDFYAANMVH